jgi:hypothetical protein
MQTWYLDKVDQGVNHMITIFWAIVCFSDFKKQMRRFLFCIQIQNSFTQIINLQNDFRGTNSSDLIRKPSATSAPRRRRRDWRKSARHRRQLPQLRRPPSTWAAASWPLTQGQLRSPQQRWPRGCLPSWRRPNFSGRITGVGFSLTYPGMKFCTLVRWILPEYEVFYPVMFTFICWVRNRNVRNRPQFTSSCNYGM